MKEIIKKLEDVLSNYDNDKILDIQSVAALCKEKLINTFNDEQKVIFYAIFHLESVRNDMLIGDNDEAFKSLCQLADYLDDCHPLRGNSNETEKDNDNIITTEFKREFGNKTEFPYDCTIYY